MKKSIFAFLLFSMLILSITACGSKEEAADYSEFYAGIDSFCTSFAEFDAKINSLSPENDDISSLLSEMDKMNQEYARLAGLEYPEEYVSLKELATEGSDYMDTAAGSFRNAFTSQTLTPEEFDSIYEYARENYSRAYKRIQVIVSVLNNNSSNEQTN